MQGEESTTSPAEDSQKVSLTEQILWLGQPPQAHFVGF